MQLATFARDFTSCALRLNQSKQTAINSLKRIENLDSGHLISFTQTDTKAAKSVPKLLYWLLVSVHFACVIQMQGSFKIQLINMGTRAAACKCIRYTPLSLICSKTPHACPLTRFFFRGGSILRPHFSESFLCVPNAVHAGVWYHAASYGAAQSERWARVHGQIFITVAQISDLLSCYGPSLCILIRNVFLSCPCLNSIAICFFNTLVVFSKICYSLGG